VINEEPVVLDCPYCKKGIDRPLSWFQQPYFTCPACGGGLNADQFAAIVAELDRAFEETVDHMLQGEDGCRCGGCKPTDD